MRIVCYNILDGGVGRADPLAEVLLAQRADVIALFEADDLAILERIAGRLRMDYLQAAGSGRAKGAAPARAAALLSRWPIVETINHAAIRPNAPAALLEAKVASPEGAEWIIGVAQIDAEAGTNHAEQARVVLEAFEPHRSGGRAHLLAVCEDEGAVFLTRLRDAGYANAVPAESTSPMEKPRMYMRGSSPATGAILPDEQPPRRVDRILTWGVERQSVTAAWVERDRLAKYASDHYPTGAEVRAV